MREPFSHMTYDQRKQLKSLLESGNHKVTIAHILGVSGSTVYREIERGSRNGIYDPDYADQQYRQKLAQKGADPILSNDPELVAQIRKMILEDKLNLTQIVNKLREDNRFENPPKTRVTIYRAIENGLIPDVTIDHLNVNTTKVFNDGQIHLAKWVRDRLDIKDGDILYFEIDGDTICFSKKDFAK